MRISARFSFREFLAEMQGKDYAEVLQLAVDEDDDARRARKAPGARKARYRPWVEYSHQLTALIWFMRNLIKPIGLRDEEFEMLRPLCENWIAKGQMPPTVRELFNKKTT